MTRKTFLLTSGDIGLFTGPHLVGNGQHDCPKLGRRLWKGGHRSMPKWNLVTGVFAYQISFLEVSSSTIRLSIGDRPVFFPEYAVSAPVLVIAVPVS
jgi:hypothetical protein